MQKNIWTDCRLGEDKVGNNKLAKDRLQKKLYNDYWLKIDCEQSYTIMFDQK